MTGEAVPHELAPGATLPGRAVHARNLFRDAANRIHDDAGARQHGYAGALVAGVTIYGYLTRLVVEACGIEWLRRGTATVRFARPVYDGGLLALSGRIVGRSGRREAGEVLAEIEARGPRGEVAASMAAGLAWGGPVIAPDPRGYPAAPLPASPPPATAETLASLDPLGAPALLLDAALLGQAAEDLEDPSPSYRGPEAVAHPGLLLRQANRALSENVALGPLDPRLERRRALRSGARRGPPGDAGPRRAGLRAEGTWLGRPRSPDRRRRHPPHRPHSPHRHLSHVRIRRVRGVRGTGKEARHE